MQLNVSTATTMKPLNPSAPTMQEFVVARCETQSEARAMTRWILPVLQQWPSSAWHMWIADASDCSALKSARIAADGQQLEWRNVERYTPSPQDSLCSMLSGHFGLVILGHHLVAADAARGLDGLVSQLIRFAKNDPLVQPLAKSFAAYGVKLAA